jgi:hypothetical protein
LLGTTAFSPLGSSHQDFLEDDGVVVASGGPSTIRPRPYATPWDSSRA